MSTHDKHNLPLLMVGVLPTMNQDDYPGLGQWWVQLRTGTGNDEVFARIYGDSPQQAKQRAEAISAIVADREHRATQKNTLGSLHNLTVPQLRELAMRDCSQYSNDDLFIAWELFDRLVEGDRIMDDDRKRHPKAGTEILQQLNEVLQYLENETMKLEAAYGHNFKPHATEKARAITEKLKVAIYAISTANRQHLGEVVVTKTPEGEIIAVTRQDEEGRILSVIAEADRKRRGEPVAWRVHPFDYGVGYEGVYALTSRPDQVAAWERKGWEVQPLFTAPQPAEPVKVPSDADILFTMRHLERHLKCIDGAIPTLLSTARALLARYGQINDPVKVDAKASVPSVEIVEVSTTQALTTLGKVISGYRPGEEGWTEEDQQVYDAAMTVPQPLSDRDIFSNPVKHDLYKTGDKDAPEQIRDRNGVVVLDCCKRCGKFESQLSESCVAEPVKVDKYEPKANE